MSKLLLHLAPAMIVLGLLAGAASAAPTFKSGNPNFGNIPGCGPSGGRPSKCSTVPEIDPATGIASLAVVLAGLALVAERRRSRREPPVA